MRRARVTIDFFELDGREELWRGRAERITYLYQVLELRDHGEAGNRDLAERAVKTLISSASEHTSCARAFYQLYGRDRQRAMEIASSAQEYLDRQS